MRPVVARLAPGVAAARRPTAKRTRGRVRASRRVADWAADGARTGAVERRCRRTRRRRRRGAPSRRWRLDGGRGESSMSGGWSFGGGTGQAGDATAAGYRPSTTRRSWAPDAPERTVAEPHATDEQRDRHGPVAVRSRSARRDRPSAVSRGVGVGDEPGLVVGQLEVAVAERDAIARASPPRA